MLLAILTSSGVIYEAYSSRRFLNVHGDPVTAFTRDYSKQKQTAPLLRYQ